MLLAPANPQATESLVTSYRTQSKTELFSRPNWQVSNYWKLQQQDCTLQCTSDLQWDASWRQRKIRTVVWWTTAIKYLIPSRRLQPNSTLPLYACTFVSISLISLFLTLYYCHVRSLLVIIPHKDSKISSLHGLHLSSYLWHCLSSDKHRRTQLDKFLLFPFHPSCPYSLLPSLLSFLVPFLFCFSLFLIQRLLVFTAVLKLI